MMVRSFPWIALRISTAHNIATLVTQSFKMATVGVGTKSRDKKGFFVSSKEKGRREKLKNIWKRKCCNVEGDGGVSTKNKKHRSPQLQPSRQTSNRVTRAGQSCGWNKSHRAVGAGRGRPIFDVNCTFAAGRSIYLISSFYLNIFPSFIII